MGRNECAIWRPPWKIGCPPPKKKWKQKLILCTTGSASGGPSSSSQLGRIPRLPPTMGKILGDFWKFLSDRRAAAEIKVFHLITNHNHHHSSFCCPIGAGSCLSPENTSFVTASAVAVVAMELSLILRLACGAAQRELKN